MLDKRQTWSRRNLLRLAATAGTASLVAPALLAPALAAERERPRISDVRTMTVQGPGRTCVYVKTGLENMREAIGWDHDLMVHCHWELDLPSALQLAEVIAPIKPLWLEDPLGVDYSDSWRTLAARSPAPILTGENLARREGFLPFLANQGCQLVNPDLRNSGGLPRGR